MAKRIERRIQLVLGAYIICVEEYVRVYEIFLPFIEILCTLAARVVSFINRICRVVASRMIFLRYARENAFVCTCSLLASPKLIRVTVAVSVKS